MSFRESYMVLKEDFEELVKGRKVIKKKREGNLGQYERSPNLMIMKKQRRKKHHTTPPKQDPLMEELLRLGAKFPGNVKKTTSVKSSSKKQDAAEYFGQGKKRKVWKLMRFLEDNHDVSIGDDYVIKVGGKEIPGSDFIDVMHFLMNDRGTANTSFYPTMDAATKMPVGTKRFIDVLYRVIEKKPMSAEITREEKEAFGEKFQEFAGTAAEGVTRVLMKIQNDLRLVTPTVDLRNISDEVDQIADSIELEEEQERAQQLMDDIQLEEDLVKEREENKMALTALAKKKNTGKRILGRLGLEKEDYGHGIEAEEEKALLNKKKRRTYHKAIESIAEQMKRIGGPETIAERQVRKYKEALESKDPEKIAKYQSPGLWERTYTLGLRRADKEGVGPTMREKMELESLKQTPTFGKIIEDNIIRKLFARS